MNEERNYVIKVTCIHCKKEYALRVRFKDYMIYDSPNRPHIQDIFPYLTPAERELLISHTCDECWQKMFDAFVEEAIEEGELEDAE